MMTPERISELRRLVMLASNDTCLVSVERLTECLDEIDRQANEIGELGELKGHMAELSGYRKKVTERCRMIEAENSRLTKENDDLHSGLDIANQFRVESDEEAIRLFGENERMAKELTAARAYKKTVIYTVEQISRDPIVRVPKGKMAILIDDPDPDSPYTMPRGEP